MTTVFNKQTGDLWNAEMTLRHEKDIDELFAFAMTLFQQRVELISHLANTNDELAHTISKLNEYEKKDFRCDQITPPDLTDAQTCHENQVYLAEISGELINQ